MGGFGIHHYECNLLWNTFYIIILLRNFYTLISFSKDILPLPLLILNSMLLPLIFGLFCVFFSPVFSTYFCTQRYPLPRPNISHPSIPTNPTINYIKFMAYFFYWIQEPIFTSPQLEISFFSNCFSFYFFFFDIIWFIDSSLLLCLYKFSLRNGSFLSAVLLY